jgi:hypothetical protein
MNKLLQGLLSLVVSSCVVLPTLHVALRPSPARYVRSPDGPPEMARELAAAQVAAWDDGQRDVARQVNPEWDLGHHTFLALGLTNLAIDATPALRETYRAKVDAVVAEVRARPQQHFHLAYFDGAFRDRRGRSLFVDGEVLLMLAGRLAVWPDPARHAELAGLAKDVVGEMSAGPVLMGESYPNECWMYDNTLALAALAVTGHVLGHAVEGAEALTQRWLAGAARLTDPHTGLLVASTTWDGGTLDGPEGSSAFAVAHFLELVDAKMAREQYERAKERLVVRPLGFAYAHEWPDPALWGKDPLPVRAGMPDVDSGPVIPLVHAGAGASGMAVLGATAFHDDALVAELVTSMELAAFPERKNGALRFRATNGLGDAVLLYAMAQGPLWRLVRAGKATS